MGNYSNEKLPTSSASYSSLKSLMEPPQSFFPLKREFLKLIVVLALVLSAAVLSNFLTTALIIRRPRPFCYSNLDFPDSFSVEGSLSSSRIKRKREVSNISR
ncbi:Inner nuclear membrane Man1 [Quillaja saponaria]|uniref:Inner nuclear membrane Man1 n=1 Tax=Quillaja saponaria TaxID=32244 RepID=A0AAD7L707_QUISA|nr:Inner nuclear membrane Man1 [Quillaja saponaria]